MIKVKHGKISRVCQGDIYKNIEYIENIKEKSGIITISKILFPYVIILTQDCDLRWDFHQRWSKKNISNNQDKWILSVLVAPLYNVEHVYEGEHLSELHMTMQKINRNKTPGEYLIKNEIPRYHYIKFPNNVEIVDSVIDFKHYFSVHVEYLKSVKKENFICRISELFREDISIRFANFLSRVGLP
jgi:hypothetical protein